jgi:putative RecB family exonuclease
MGDMVHQALEKLYSMLKFQKTMSVEEVIIFFNTLWQKEYVPEILVAKASQGLTAEDYKKMGEKFIIDYYFKHTPFNDLTIIGLETQDRMTLTDGNQWHVRIDKLGFDSEGNYYVCDYKTNSRMKAQAEADDDRQLAMYSLWVAKKFSDARKVILRWHMLAFNKDVESVRNEADLEKLQYEIVEKIKEIEAATEFPTHKTALCNYCIFKDICPVFGHKIALGTEDKKSELKLTAEEGKKLVDEYSLLDEEIKIKAAQQVEIGNKLINFALNEGIENIYGTDKKVSVKNSKRIVLPEGIDRAKLLNLLKDKHLLTDFSMLNYSKINARAKRGELDPEIMSELSMIEDWKVRLSKNQN